MWRAFLWLLVLMAVAGAAAWVADQPGMLRLAWLGYEITAPAALVALLLAATGIGLMAVVWIVAWAFAIPMRRRLKRAARGQAAFAAGMIAIAAGEPARARKLAGKARALLDDPTLARLLDAHAAQLGDDPAATRTAFAALAADPATAFLGVRGLIADAASRGDRGEALQLAARASALRPASPFAAQTELRLLLENGDWPAARARLAEAKRRKAIAGADHVRLSALIDLAEAEAAARLGHGAAAFKLARQASRALSRHCGVAAVMARAADSPALRQEAQENLRRLWPEMPSAALAALWQQLEAAQGRTAEMRAQRVRLLTDGAPHHPAAVLLLAEAALDARDFALARESLGSLPEISGWAAALQARLSEDGDGDMAEADRWRRRAAGAQDLWTCSSCGAGHAEWSARCSACQSFDTVAPASAHPPAQADALIPGQPAAARLPYPLGSRS